MKTRAQFPSKMVVGRSSGIVFDLARVIDAAWGVDRRVLVSDIREKKIKILFHISRIKLNRSWHFNIKV